MNRCRNCGMNLLDPSGICPLCRSVIERHPNTEAEAIYPRTERKIRKIQRALQIYLFAAIAATVILGIINAKQGGHWSWLVLIVVFFAYGYVTLRVSIVMHTGYRLKMIMQSLLGVLVVMAIDGLNGANGWSIEYVLPAVFILLDVAIIILMIVNSRNWQSYISMQILVIILCIVPILLYYFHITNSWLMAAVAMSVALLTFLGTVIIGGKRARTELYRRFHI